MNLSLRKLYADLVSEDGTAMIVYLAWLNLWQVRHRYAAVEIYSADGNRRLLPGRVAVDAVSGLDANRLEIALHLPHGDFCLRYESALPPWTPAGPAPAYGLRWSVHVPRAFATAQLLDRGDRSEVRGIGYADWVELDRTVRTLRLSRIRWGRAHVGEECMIYAAIDRRGVQPWSRSARWRADGTLAETPVRLRQALASGAVLVETSDTTLAIEPARLLHDGAALDSTRVPNPLLRAASRLATGGIRETRWLGFASISETRARPAAVALYEDVRFG